MNQSNVIFGAILIAFLIFITARGELPNYIAIMRGGGASTSSGGSTFVGSQQTPIGELPQTINGIPIEVTGPSQATGDPVLSLLKSPGSLGIPAINSSFLQGL